MRFIVCGFIILCFFIHQIECAKLIQQYYTSSEDVFISVYYRTSYNQKRQSRTISHNMRLGANSTSSGIIPLHAAVDTFENILDVSNTEMSKILLREISYEMKLQKGAEMDQTFITLDGHKLGVRTVFTCTSEISEDRCDDDQPVQVPQNSHWISLEKISLVLFFVIICANVGFFLAAFSHLFHNYIPKKRSPSVSIACDC